MTAAYAHKYVKSGAMTGVKGAAKGGGGGACNSVVSYKGGGGICSA